MGGNNINGVGNWLYGNVWRPIEEGLYNYQETIDEFVGTVVKETPQKVEISDRAASMLVMLFSILPLSCDTEQSQEQEQSIEIRPDQLGSIGGTVYIEFPSGELIPWSTFAYGQALCSGYEATHRCGKYSVVTESVTCKGKFQGTDTLKINVSYAGSSELEEACEQDPVCQANATVQVNTDSTYSIGNLLVGEYKISTTDWFWQGGSYVFEPTSCDIQQQGGDCPEGSTKSYGFSLPYDPVPPIVQSVGYGTSLDIILNSSASYLEGGDGCEAYDYWCIDLTSIKSLTCE